MKFERVAAQPEVDLRDVGVFRAQNFPESQVKPWLDRADYAEQIDGRLHAGEISADEATLCRKWAQDGYVVIEKMFSDADLDGAWEAYENAIASGVLKPQSDYGQSIENKPGRVLNPHLKIPAFAAMLKAERAVALVSLLLGVKALPFQTIAGHIGSQQKPHSDSIHMTTYPQGFLVANWIAFEDIAPDSGPLEFYPGSHRLPYIYSRDCDISLDEGRAGYGAYHAKYESAVQNAIDANGLTPHYFLANKGDVLFWHANLFHGGSSIRNPESSRRALVCHYFAEGCVCYHDYTGSPSHITKVSPQPRHLLAASEFDSAGYLTLNPDVAAAGVDAYRHYREFGFKEGRPIALHGRPVLRAAEFDARRYLQLNPDVAAAGVDAYQHYLQFGYAEDRRTT